jgi:hypothetical protein
MTDTKLTEAGLPASTPQLIQTAIGPARVMAETAILSGMPALFVKYKREDFDAATPWPFQGNYAFKVIPKNGKE